MKNLIYAAGFLTAGVASLALSTSLQAQDGSKRWTVGLGARGFFDDNIFTRPDLTVNGVKLRQDSFGVEITPSINFNLPLSQGSIDLGYTYGLRWFENRPGDDIDQYHSIVAGLNHQFSPRYKISVSENFAIAQEPEQLAAAGGVSLPFRSEGDNIRNTAGAIFTAQLTDVLSGDVNYNNNYFDYSNPGFDQALDRLEHLFGLNLRYQVRPTTFAVVGYQYGIFDYTSKIITGTAGNLFNPNMKDQTSHFIYGGVDHNFTSKLLGSVRVGVQIAEWDKLGQALNQHRSRSTPYADASLSYAYASGSSIRIGLKHQRNATDLFDEFNSPVLDTESTAVFLSVSQKITEKLNVTGTALFQNSNFEAPGTAIQNKDEQYWNFGITASYRFTQYLSGEFSYYYDNLDSNLLAGTRGYDRNRVFLGVRLTY